jgi:uncharacterized protein HemY
LELIGSVIILVIVLIVVLEICRFFRRIGNLPREIDDLRKKVSNIEDIINNQNK